MPTRSRRASGFSSAAYGRMLQRALRHLEQPGRPHPAANAHRHHHILHATALALDQRMADQSAAGGAVRMTNRDRAAVDVEPLVRDAELVATVNHLHGERLV